MCTTEFYFAPRRLSAPARLDDAHFSERSSETRLVGTLLAERRMPVYEKRPRAPSTSAGRAHFIGWGDRTIALSLSTLAALRVAASIAFHLRRHRRRRRRLRHHPDRYSRPPSRAYAFRHHRHRRHPPVGWVAACVLWLNRSWQSRVAGLPLDVPASAYSCASSRI